ncbi:OLC1v1017996C1 [Oldenlandia corymbosa var. corymbosa]|uniref:OLC1v1017996C1 n=1 Tax=Oldenlandia corymbosa var. corymbosa TaxID=529605 RepID=A0AAV1EAM5_OLDCO|nr:OLC1v1017996C1 [Oldenlandia corymbosa var. corymbosa]
MALTGEEKDMRMPGSLGFDSLDNLDHNTHNHHHHIQAQPEQQQLIQEPKIRPLGNSATNALNSGGSKPKSSSPFGRSNNSSNVRYRECLKNHAASIGGNVTDGCGEFMPGGEEGSLEAFKCAACQCHRNFHRKEISGENSSAAIVVHQLQLPPPLPSPSMNHRGGGGGEHHWTTTMVQPVKMAFGGSGGGGGGSASAATDSSSEELNFNAYQSTSIPPPPQFVLAKKRFRTKFSTDQKEKMLAFADKLGWRIPREDDTEVQRFCAEVGVKRQVFKVWMHNNKNSAKKTPQDQS